MFTPSRIDLDLSPASQGIPDPVLAHLAELGAAIEREAALLSSLGSAGRRRFHDPTAVAGCLRRVASFLEEAQDRHALSIRADAVERGYDDEGLSALSTMEEDVAVVAGQIATWFGKSTGGLPTAFACRRDPAGQAIADRARDLLPAASPYLRRLRCDLELGPVPAFAVADLFFMAGEGDLHPKHIAYFLPEDEGVKHSPAKKTFYFANTHRALVEGVARPLFERHVDIGLPFVPSAEGTSAIPVLGVLAHEAGHFVRRPATDYAELNAARRWASVALQEIAADVFGTLLAAEAWAEPLGLRPHDVVAYYLAECLRYVDRGLGLFPDSDGMFLQLGYLVGVGALEVVPDEVPRLAGDPEAVLAGLRSLARCLADTLLAGDAAGALALHDSFGPARPERLAPLVAHLRREPPRSIEYVRHAPRR